MFERLTNYDYVAGIKVGDLKTGINQEKAFDRLAQYEDSGLSPDEVQDLAKAKAEGRLVEVVRCGKCRHYNTTGCSDGCGWCENMDRGVFDEHYCSRGERREKE